MQKNKFIHEDIKAVCSSAAKKLVACGLVAATTVGGANFAGLSYKNTACAQTGENQQLYDETLSYNYVDLILNLISSRPNEVIERLLNHQEQLFNLLHSDGVPEELLKEYEACLRQVTSTRELCGGLFYSTIAVEKWLFDNGQGVRYDPKGGDSVELLLSSARDNERYRKSYVEEANRYNLEPLADEINEGYTRIADGYRALAERVRANGGCVNDAIINELIELRVMDQNNHYDFTEALINERLRRDNNWISRVEDTLQRAYNHDLALGLSEAVANANRERDRQRLMANPTEINAFEAEIEARAREIANEQLRRDNNWMPRVEDVLQRAYELECLELNEVAAAHNRNQNRQRLMANPTEINAFEAEIEARAREIANEQLRNDHNWNLRLEAALQRAYEYDLAFLGLSIADENLRSNMHWLMANPTEIDAFEEEIEARARVEAALQRAYNLDLALGLSVDTANVNRERDWQRLMDNPTEIDAFEAEIEARARDAREIETLERRLAELRARRPAQQNDLVTPQMIQARGNQHIEAGPNTHVHSFSDNELIHEGAGEARIIGPGSVNIDDGGVTVSECDEDLSRNVTVNQANSLTVAPNVPMRIQNGTEFMIGRTAQETAENILRALSPNSLRNTINRFTNQD